MIYTPNRRDAQVRCKAGRGPSWAEDRSLAEIFRRGGLVIAYRNGVRTTSLADGTPASRLRSFDLNLAIELGWLRPDPMSPALLPGVPAQRYLPSERFVVEENRR